MNTCFKLETYFVHNEIPKDIVYEKKIIIVVKFRESYMVVKKLQDSALVNNLCNLKLSSDASILY